MTEKEIESRIISSLRQTLDPDVQIVSVWNTAVDGILANLESPTSPSIVDVRVDLRQYDTAQIPIANIPCSITVYTRIDSDPMGDKSLLCAEKIMELLQRMQDSLDYAISTLETPDFTIAGFRIDGGQSFNDINQGLRVLETRFTLRGTVVG